MLGEKKQNKRGGGEVTWPLLTALTNPPAAEMRAQRRLAGRHRQTDSLPGETGHPAGE